MYLKLSYFFIEKLDFIASRTSLFCLSKFCIKNIIIFISVILVMYFIFFFKLPYYVDAPGGLTNLSDRFTIEGATSSKGT